MSHVQKLKNGRYQARYPDDTGHERAKNFRRKSDADRHVKAMELAVATNSYIDPRRSTITLSEWAEIWLGAQGHLKPSTRARYESTLRNHVLPYWGRLGLRSVGHTGVRTWCSEVTDKHSPDTARKAHRILSLMLDLAVQDGRIPKNVARGAPIASSPSPDRTYLSFAEVKRLSLASDGDDGLIVLFLAMTGCRFGEMAALRVNRIDHQRRRIEIAASVTSVNGRLVWGTTKGHDRRWIYVPSLLWNKLMTHIGGKSPQDLVFTSPQGEVLRAGNFRRRFYKAVAKAEIPRVRPHDLRHTAASLAIKSGASVKVVQAMLGHKSATLTLDLYGHLFPDEHSDVARRMNSQARAAGIK